MINNLFMISPTIFLVEESQNSSFFKPNKVSELISLKSGATLFKFDKMLGLGICLGVLHKSKTIMFGKLVDSSVRF